MSKGFSIFESLVELNKAKVSGMQALPSKCQDVAGMARRLGLTKEFQAGLLDIGQSLAIPVRLQPPQLGIRHIGVKYQPPAS